MSRRVVIELAAAAVIVGGWVFLLLGPRGSDATSAEPSLPVTITEDSERGPRADLDLDGWRDTFARIDLPPPPPIRAADPVPISRLSDAVGRWCESRSPAALGEVGSIYLAMEEHEAAAACFAAAAELDPNDPRWTYLLGAECQTLALNSRAVAAFERAIELDPDYATTYARLGALRLLEGDLDAAETAYRNYVDRKPDISIGYTGLGEVAMARGKHGRALAALTTAVRMSPNDFLAHRFLARVFAAMGRDDDARRVAAHADTLPLYSGWLSFDERLREAHALAQSQRHLENSIRLAMAEDALTTAGDLMVQLLERRPKDADMRGRLAAVYANLGRVQDAQREVDRALADLSSSSSLWQTAAEIAMNAKDFRAARVAIDTMIDLDAESARGFDLRGRVRYADGDMAGAIDDLRRAIDLGGDEIPLRLAIASILVKLDQRDEARLEVDRILEMRPDHPQARAMKIQLTP